MKKLTTLILSGEDVILIVENFGIHNILDELIARLETTLFNYNQDTFEIPIRSGFSYNKPAQGLIEWMPVQHKSKDVVIKVVGYHPKNPTKYLLPTILSTIASYDTLTGHLKGLSDGVLLTALRTGATSAVASKYLARPDSSVLGLIGCGAQAITQLHALSRLFPLKKVLIYDVDKNVTASFKERTSLLGLTADIDPSDIHEIVSCSDIISTQTSIEANTGPLFHEIPSREYLHINAVGSDFPGKTELPKELLLKSFVCPDFLGQALIEGECQQLSNESIGPDLVSLLQNHEAYEDVKNKRTVFDSTGWALEDYVVLELFLELAEKFGIGQHIAIENISEDAQNPYHFLTRNVPDRAVLKSLF